MGRIDWDDSFSVHHEELDSQHQKLVELYNELHEALLNGSVQETTTKRNQTLNSLVEYIDYHFSSEEAYLKEINLPNFDEHCYQHRKFAKKVKALHHEVLEGNLVVTTSIIKFMRNWIIDHILIEDKANSTYFTS